MDKCCDSQLTLVIRFFFSSKALLSEDSLSFLSKGGRKEQNMSRFLYITYKRFYVGGLQMTCESLVLPWFSNKTFSLKTALELCQAGPSEKKKDENFSNIILVVR